MGEQPLVIAHRLSTVQNAHQIALCSNGRIAELRTHSELLGQKEMHFFQACKQVRADFIQWGFCRDDSVQKFMRIAKKINSLRMQLKFHVFSLVT
ncbi:hypothetical protein Vadar_017709 [Vaccinium darrowii]|uniref:Uncharacterized protein n=1 Tax=Vaccinium darrowii TaxID=229202 RepID=A0ACB7X1H9_9ERIC|nr:hypothetical protein Vadar_017709 [Vaccinium darrowii]